MQPLKPEEKKKLIAAAAKSFPKKSADMLEREFSEMERLSAKRFQAEDGCLSAHDQKRLKELNRQFCPE